MTRVLRSVHYKDRYGAWAGNPKGNRPNYERCCEAVFRNFHAYQCTRLRGCGPDEAYCRQHDPAVKKRREEASRARQDLAFRSRRLEMSGASFFEVIKKIAAGHDDPRQLAQKTIDEFER